MNEQKRKEMFKKTFDTVAAGYDNPSMRFFPDSAKQMAACLRLRGDEHILDVATGTGNAALALSGFVPRGRVTGIDFSEGMLAEAREKKETGNVGNVDFIEMDMQSIGFSDRHFDAAVCAFGIFFVEDMECQLRHIAGKVKQGGSLLISSFYKTTFSPLSEMLLARLEKYGIELPPMSWKRIASKELCASLFSGAGLGDIRVEQKNLGYFLENSAGWWDLVRNAGYRGLINQVAPGDRERFKAEHLKEVADQAGENGIRLEVEVLYTMGNV